MPDQNSNGECWPGGLRNQPGSLKRRVNLRENQTGMFEKGLPGRSQLNATHAAVQKLEADLRLKIASDG